MNNNPPPPGDELDPLYRAVFDDPQNGTPDDITQAGCLALARLGKDAWNAWRQKYPVRYLVDGSFIISENSADFRGFDFLKETIDFKGFVLDHEAHFDDAKFGNDTSFDNAQFGNNERFYGAQFGYFARFVGLNWASLTSQFSKRPGGLEAAKARAELRGLSPETFKSINFNGVEFTGQPNFSGGAFEGPTSFGRLNYSIDIKRRSLDGNIIELELPEGQPVVFGQAPL
ncbi:MAG: pentapeptide repeat-containing protein, partial [Methylococcales bacterium]|nr:pentapeptide repeat-containing protein [Methylococcales bacterium]